MASGTCERLADLPVAAAAILTSARRGVLATLDPNGLPHAVPVCFAVVDLEFVTAVDHKPKTAPVPARIRNASRTGSATLLFDRWDEQWTRLGWVMATCSARVEQPGWGRAALVDRYPQYRERPPEGPTLVLTPTTLRWWLWA